jgi:hypothetical protein
MDDVDVGLASQARAGQVGRRPDALRRIGDRPRLRLGGGDDPGKRTEFRLAGDDQEVRRPADQGNRHECLGRIVRNVLVQAHIVGDRAVRREQQAVAVRRRDRHRVAADVAAGAGPVLDHHRLLPVVLQLRGNDPAHHVDRAAGEEWNHDGDALRRIGLRGGRAGCGAAGRRDGGRQHDSEKPVGSSRQCVLPRKNRALGLLAVTLSRDLDKCA